MAHSIALISIVICNLYSFTVTIAHQGCTFVGAMEEIDIGGTMLLRTTVNMKNHIQISVLSGAKK